MVTTICILSVSIFFIIKGALLSTKYAVRVAENFNISKFIVGLIIVAVISILPETFVSINAVMEGAPGLGLGTLFGSNVADLTLVFGIIILFSGRKNIKIENKVLKSNAKYPFFLLLPIVLGLDGHYGRIEGIALILVGLGFYYFASRNSVYSISTTREKGNKIKNLFCLLGGIALLILGSHFAVTAGIDIANSLGINPVLIGILVIGLGTVIPELLFAYHAVKKYDDSLAVGDVLGTVLADATIVVGGISVLCPFYFPQNIVYITGIFMLIASFIISYVMHTGKVITKREGILLILFWITFVVIEYLTNRG